MRGSRGNEYSDLGYGGVRTSSRGVFKRLALDVECLTKVAVGATPKPNNDRVVPIPLTLNRSVVMNIIEAIRSGKAFKRKSKSAWFSQDGLEDINFNLDEIIAEDWEVHEGSLTVTATTIREAYQRVRKSLIDEPTSRLLGENEFQERLIKELGL